MYWLGTYNDKNRTPGLLPNEKKNQEDFQVNV